MTTRLWGAPVTVNATTLGNQIQPAITLLSNGNLVLVWQDPANNGDIVGRFFSQTGSPLGSEFVIAGGVAAQVTPDVTALTNGTFQVVLGSGANVSRVLVSASGTPGGVINVDSPASLPAIASAPDGSFAFAYTKNADIDIGRYGTTGSALSFQTVNTTTTGAQAAPAIARLDTGQYAIAWQDQNTLTIRSRVMNADGTFVSADFNVSAGTLAADPSVTALANGAFLVTYSSTRTVYPASSTDVYGIVYDVTGAPQTGAFLVNTFTAGSQVRSQAVALGDGRFMVAWVDFNSPDSIRTQVFFPDGSKDGREVLVSTVGDVILGGGAALDATLLSDGRVAITWTADGTPGDSSGSGLQMQIVDPRDGFIQGTSGIDTLYGGDLADQIVAREGNDTIYALNGDDLIYAGTGNDTVDGGNGDDIIYGQDGNDTITAGEGNNTVTAGSGTDSIVGGGGVDTLDGGADADTIYGLGNNDFIDGGTGDDAILGGAGDDTIFGNSGSDQITGGTGVDTLYGGADSDLFIYYGGDGTDILMDFTPGSAADIVALSVAGITSFADVQARLSFFSAGNSTLLTLPDGSQMFFNGITPNQLDASDFAFFGASLVSGSVTLDPAAAGDSLAEAPALAFEDVLTPSSPADFSLHLGGYEGMLVA